MKLLSHVQLVVTPWTAAYQAPPSMGFSRQEYWSGLPLPSPRTPYDPANPLLGIYTEETRIERDTCTPMFIAALLITARTWKQPRYPSAGESISKLWYIYTMEYSVQFSSVQCSVVSHSLQPHESQHTRPPCPSPTPGVHSDSRPSSQ